MSEDQKAAIEALSFEDALTELEQIVGKLEGGQAPLQDLSIFMNVAACSRRIARTCCAKQRPASKKNHVGP